LKEAGVVLRYGINAPLAHRTAENHEKIWIHATI